MTEDEFLNLTPPPVDKRLSYGSDPNQFGELRLPAGAGPFPVVMNIHGGFWRNLYGLGHAGHYCAALTRSGFATWNVEYRRAGDKGGGWPGSLEDLALAYRFIRQNAAQHNLDRGRFLVSGHSAGGHLALCLAAHEPTLEHVMPLAAVSDARKCYELHLSNDAVVEFLGGTPDSVPEHYREASPFELSIKAKQWLVHGNADDVVPFSFSSDYIEAKKEKETVSLLALPKAGHFDVINPFSEVWPEMDKLVSRLLQSSVNT
ncbi:MAG TPA: alpha/beta hydrolase [Oculatellaceae cyanobacterium]